MNKKDEALKLALEALDRSMRTTLHNSLSIDCANAIAAIREALAEQPAISAGPITPAMMMLLTTEQKRALLAMNKAEQPAQQQEPKIGETNVELGFYTNIASNGQQRELVGAVEMGQLMGNRSHEVTGHSDAEREIAVITGVDEHGPMLGWYGHWINYPVGTKFYTSPQPSKPWVGLTDEDFREIYQTTEWEDSTDTWDYERAIEAKLREKNAALCKPLTDEQIEACIHHVDEDGIGLFAFARAIEAAHGIK